MNQQQFPISADLLLSPDVFRANVYQILLKAWDCECLEGDFWAIYRLQKRRLPNLDCWIKSLAQRPDSCRGSAARAADPRPEPCFRGRILAFSPTNSVAVLLESLGHVGSSRRLGIFVDDSRSGLDFGLFLLAL